MGIIADVRRVVETVKLVLNHPVQNRGGWLPIVRESFQGAWQRNIEVDQNLVLSFHAVFACMTLIASDIAKLRIKLMERNRNGIWVETENPAYSPVLRKPNHFQTRIQFMESWMLSKLANGNAYALKQRDGRNVVTRLYILDPHLVKPLISDSEGAIFYELNADNLPGIGRLIVPAREIIHDRMNCLFHPLVGVSPIFASGLAATGGLNIQTDSAVFFGNLSQPGGLLIAPGRIDDATALRVKQYWETNYSGSNRGKVAVVGDGLKYQGLSVNAEDSQLIEQLKYTAEVVCSTFHVPRHKIQIGQQPTYNNIEALNLEYYSQCLQRHIEDIELLLDEGLETGPMLGTEFDVDNLLRMDTVTATTAAQNAIRAGFLAPNEARRKFDLPPVDGGETPYLQQQNFSLAALAKRDAKEDPFGKAQPAQPRLAPASPPPAAANSNDERALNGFEIRALLAEGAGNVAR